MNKIEVLKAEKDGLDVWPDLLRYAAEDTPVDQIPEDDLQRMKWYGVFHRPQTPGTFMMRLRLAGGRATSAQLRVIAGLAEAGLDVHELGYFVIHSRDGHYFETLSRDEALDPRVMLVSEMNGSPLPHEYGGPVRLVVPFLQGYKSVKWVARIHAYRHDPIGIKRLLGQSKSGALGRAWLDRLSIVPAEGRPGDPAPERP